MSTRLLVASRKGLFDMRPDDGGWAIAQRAFLGDPVSMVMRDPRDGAIYAALNLGHFGAKLHRSDDDMATWTEVATPSYADVPGEPAPSLKMIWALEIGADGCVWAGTIPGGLFRSDDQGATWTLNQALWDHRTAMTWFGGGYDEAGIHSICVHPHEPHRIAVAVSTGGVWLSDDDGASWRISNAGLYAEYMPPDQRDTPAQDVHRMVRCPGAPDCFWIQHHNGAFRSTDGAATWQEVLPKPAKFGFGVAVHPHDPDTAWFAPAIKDEKRYPVDSRFVLSRTRDGGRRFKVLRSGLPRGESYDIVYRHSLDVDATGEVLAVGSTTGNLWISQNGGDRWRAISHHLPPIYALRFV